MERKLKVTHIIGGGEFGGAEEHLLLLLKQLQIEGIEPHVICFYDSLFAERLRERSIPVDVLAYGRFDFRLFFGLQALLRKHKPDLVHTHGVKANFFGRLAARRLGLQPVVTTVHSLLRYDYIHPLARVLATLLDKCTRGLTQHYIAISEQIKSQLLSEGIPEAKVEVIHHGIDTALYSSAPGEEELESKALAKEWGKSEGKWLVGALGRLHPVKGFDYFIEACALLHEQDEDLYRFVLVGDGSERAHLENLVREKGLAQVFHFAGFRHDVPQCLQAFDCYVSSSLSEGLGLAVLEALASGTPVVSTGVGGILDFARNEENCLLVAPRDAEGLAQAIARLVHDHDLAQALSQQAVEDIESQFSAQLMGVRTAACYRRWSNLLAANTKPRVEG